MDKEIQKHVNTYFSSFYKYSLKWKTILDEAKPFLNALKNKAEQLRYVEKARIENDFEDFPDVKDLLTFKIGVAIEEEIAALKPLITSSNEIVQDLKNKLTTFEKSTAFIDWENQEIVGGHANQPSLSSLLSLAEEGCNIYHDLYLNLSNSFKSLDVRKEITVTNLSESFQIPEDYEKKINFVIAMTQYCY